MSNDKQSSSENRHPAIEIIGDGLDAPVDDDSQTQHDNKVLDEFERLAADTILDDDEGDDPSAKAEKSTIPVEKNLPKFANFRSNPETIFEMWGVSERQGMDDTLFVTTKSFAPRFEDDVDLRKVRIYETVTPDGVVRLIWCFVPEKDGRRPNLWLTSKTAALDMSLTQWTTMRSRPKLQQYTYRPANKDHGEPKFSGLTKVQLVAQLRDQGLLVDSEDHLFFRRATDTEE
jgi:hypothetical protein